MSTPTHETNPFDLDDAHDLWAGFEDTATVLELPSAARTIRPIPTGVDENRLAAVTQEQLVLQLARREARILADKQQAEAAETAPDLSVADVDGMPISLAGTETSLTQEELEEAMLTRPVTPLDALRVARKVKTTPTLLEGEDGRRVFYRGKSNWLSGESGKGKSTLAKLSVYQEAQAAAHPCSSTGRRASRSSRRRWSSSET